MEINGITYTRFSTERYAQVFITTKAGGLGEILYRPRPASAVSHRADGTDPFPYLTKVRNSDMVMFDAGNGTSFDAHKLKGRFEEIANDIGTGSDDIALAVAQGHEIIRSLEREHTDLHLGREPDSTFAENIVCFIIGIGVACLGMWLMHLLV